MTKTNYSPMYFIVKRSVAVLIAVCFGVNPSGSCVAQLIVPDGLQPGDTYQLVFISSSRRDATSPNIEQYNLFVQTTANNAGIGNSIGVEWTAIASTENVSARDNAIISGPVYNFNGDLLAIDFSDMWDGQLENFIGFDEFGNLVPDDSQGQLISEAWTGTMPDGLTGGFNGALGSSEGPTNRAIAGNGLSSDGSEWIEFIGSTRVVPNRFYALSNVLVVGVPEPTSVVVSIVGLVALIMRRRSTHRVTTNKCLA